MTPPLRTVAVIGDLHGELAALADVVERLGDRPIDGAVLVGDFASRPWERGGGGRRALLAEVDEALAIVRRLGVPLAWVPGNHDLPGLDHPENADRRLVELAGLSVYGLGGAGPHRFGFPYEWSDEEIDALDVPPYDLLLTHAPPARCALDRLRSGAPAGSEAVRRLIERRGGVAVCGHIHEAAGVDRVGDAPVVNAGSLGLPYPRQQAALAVFGERRREVVHLDLVTGEERRRALPGR